MSLCITSSLSNSLVQFYISKSKTGNDIFGGKIRPVIPRILSKLAVYGYVWFILFNIKGTRSQGRYEHSFL